MLLPTFTYGALLPVLHDTSHATPEYKAYTVPTPAKHNIWYGIKSLHYIWYDKHKTKDLHDCLMRHGENETHETLYRYKGALYNNGHGGSGRALPSSVKDLTNRIPPI